MPATSETNAILALLDETLADANVEQTIDADVDTAKLTSAQLWRAQFNAQHRILQHNVDSL